MPNSNYLAGRAFEYKRMAVWKEKGYICARTAGSHGPFDIIAIRGGRPVELIQCKKVQSPTTGRNLIDTFRSTPPFPSNKYFHQVMEVWVKETRELLTVTV